MKNKKSGRWEEDKPKNLSNSNNDSNTIKRQRSKPENQRRSKTNYANLNWPLLYHLLFFLHLLFPLVPTAHKPSHTRVPKNRNSVITFATRGLDIVKREPKGSPARPRVYAEVLQWVEAPSCCVLPVCLVTLLSFIWIVLLFENRKRCKEGGRRERGRGVEYKKEKEGEKTRGGKEQATDWEKGKRGKKVRWWGDIIDA